MLRVIKAHLLAFESELITFVLALGDETVCRRQSGHVECRALRPALARLGYSEREVERLAAYAYDCGHLQGATGLHEEHQPMFATATSPRPITAEGHLRMVAAVQPFISGGGVKDPQPAARRHCR